MILLMLRWRMATRLIKWSYLASSPTGRDGRMSCQGEQSCFRINHHFSWTKKSQWKLPKTKSSAQVEPFDARYKRLDKHLHLRRQGGDQLFGAMYPQEYDLFYSDFPHIHFHINIKISTLRIQSSGMPLLQYVFSTSSIEDPHNKGIVLSFIIITWKREGVIW